MNRITSIFALFIALAVGISEESRAENPPTSTSRSSGKEYTNSIGMVLKNIPKGEFVMGDPDEYGAKYRQHKVLITQNFYLGETEVTQQQFETVMGFNPSYFSSTGKFKDSVVGQDTSNRPVEYVSWYDAITFCNKLSKSEGRENAYNITEIKYDPQTTNKIIFAKVSIIADTNGYRLPTEAQWEYACRAGTQTIFGFGDELTAKQANFENKLSSTRVASREANTFGLRDMHGNVQEWCWDVYDEDIYKFRMGTTKDPVVSEPSENPRVLRGGGWGNVVGCCRSGYRESHNPWYPFFDYGFRVALSSVK